MDRPWLGSRWVRGAREAWDRTGVTFGSLSVVEFTDEFSLDTSWTGGRPYLSCCGSCWGCVDRGGSCSIRDVLKILGSRGTPPSARKVLFETVGVAGLGENSIIEVSMRGASTLAKFTVGSS